MSYLGFTIFFSKANLPYSQIGIFFLLITWYLEISPIWWFRYLDEVFILDFDYTYDFLSQSATTYKAYVSLWRLDFNWMLKWADSLGNGIYFALRQIWILGCQRQTEYILLNSCWIQVSIFGGGASKYFRLNEIESWSERISERSYKKRRKNEFFLHHVKTQLREKNSRKLYWSTPLILKFPTVRNFCCLNHCLWYFVIAKQFTLADEISKKQMWEYCEWNSDLS